jgi:hypothetical protein
MAKQKLPEIEYVFFTSERVPGLNAWTDIARHDSLSFG